MRECDTIWGFRVLSGWPRGCRIGGLAPATPGFIVFGPAWALWVFAWEGKGEEGQSSSPHPGPWVGCRVASQRRPILRPGDQQYSLTEGSVQLLVLRNDGSNSCLSTCTIERTLKDTHCLNPNRPAKRLSVNPDHYIPMIPLIYNSIGYSLARLSIRYLHQCTERFPSCNQCNRI